MFGHPVFMQGVSAPDTVGHLVRILDFIPGQSLYEFLRRIDRPHREYYRNLFSGIIQSVIGCIEAIADGNGITGQAKTGSDQFKLPRPILKRPMI